MIFTILRVRRQIKDAKEFSDDPAAAISDIAVGTVEPVHIAGTVIGLVVFGLLLWWTYPEFSFFPTLLLVLVGLFFLIFQMIVFSLKKFIRRAVQSVSGRTKKAINVNTRPIEKDST